MSKWIERTFNAYQKKLGAFPMYFTFEHCSGALWSNANKNTAGPWGTAGKEFKGIVYPDWPSLSGRGWQKTQRFLAAPNTAAINYCDPKYPAATPTRVYNAFQKVYKDIPGWSDTRQPEVLFTVKEGGKPVAGINVFLAPRSRQATEPVGVKTDPKGTAWFILREPGKYAVRVEGNGKIIDNEIDVKCTTIENRGGFDYLTRATVDFDRPREIIVKAYRPDGKPKLPRDVNSQEETEAAPLPQGKESVGTEGYIRDWLVCGPFPSTGGRTDTVKAGWNIDYLTPTGGELKTVPQVGRAYQAEFKEDEQAFWENATIDIPWRNYVSPEDFIDLGKVFIRADVRGLDFAPVQFITGYAATMLVSDKEQDVRISIGSDDGYKMYLNHQLIKANRVYRGAEKDQEKIDAHLVKGKNLLLLKIDQDIGGYGFYLRVLDKADKPIVLPVANKPEAIDSQGYLHKWLICGPFANPGRGLNETTWATDYLAAHGGEAKIKPETQMNYTAEFAEEDTVCWSPGKTTVKWQEIVTETPLVDLGKLLVTPAIRGLEIAPVQNVLGYAAAYITADRSMKAKLEIDTINGVRVYWNHTIVFDKHIHRYNNDPASPNRMIFEEGNYFVPIELKKGDNILLLKIDVANGPFGFKLRLIDEKGQVVTGIHE
jgi:hypothetical protein